MSEYPEDSELEHIKNFEPHPHNLMSYVKNIWKYADIGYFSSEKILDTNIALVEYSLSTGGWSGNESIIESLLENFMFWNMYWYSSMVGGHYRFRININVKKYLRCDTAGGSE